MESIHKIKNNMRQIILLTVAAVLMSACDRLDTAEVPAVSKKVIFNLRGSEWTVTRAALSADGYDMSDLWIFDYVDGVCVQTLRKTSDDADMDSPSMSLEYGEHVLHFVASRGKNPTLSDGIIIWDTVSDTFLGSLSVTVGHATADSYAVTLDRMVAKLRVAITDQVPDNIASVTIQSAKWWKGVDYVSASASSESELGVSITVPSSYAGTTGSLVASVFGFSDATEWSTDVTVTAKDGDGNVLGKVTVQDVPLRRNRVTLMSGNLFNGGGTFDVSLNEGWDDPYNMEW